MSEQKTHLPQVSCEIVETSLLSRNGFWYPGIEARCTKCGQTAESFGRKARSERRCFAVLREKCLLGEHNIYCKKES